MIAHRCAQSNLTKACMQYRYNILVSRSLDSFFSHHHRWALDWEDVKSSFFRVFPSFSSFVGPFSSVPCFSGFFRVNRLKLWSKVQATLKIMVLQHYGAVQIQADMARRASKLSFELAKSRPNAVLFADGGLTQLQLPPATCLENPTTLNMAKGWHKLKKALGNAIVANYTHVTWLVVWLDEAFCGVPNAPTPLHTFEVKLALF